MNSPTTFSDRRKYPRYNPKQLSFVQFGEPDEGMGTILNISLGGVLFEYTPGNDNKLYQPEAPVSINSPKYEIGSVLSETIDDFCDLLDGGTRKRRIRFSALPASQIFLLKCFIYEIS